MGAAAAIGAGGALFGGASARRQADGEAALYRAQAAARLAKAEFDADTAHRKYRREAGQVQARGAGSGLDLGNFYDVMADDAMESALERAAIRWSAKTEASMLEYQAKSAIQKGKDAQTASYFKAAGAVVGAFAPMASAAPAAGGSNMGAGISLDDGGNAYGGMLK